VGDLVKSTLGPKGMVQLITLAKDEVNGQDKILQSASTGEIMVTNDGATILKSIALDNAAAKVAPPNTSPTLTSLGPRQHLQSPRRRSRRRNNVRLRPRRRTPPRSRNPRQQENPPANHHRRFPDR
jgi:hypothetical protein